MLDVFRIGRGSKWARLACGLFLVLSTALPANAESVLLQNAIVHTVSGVTLTNGSIVMEGGKITAVMDGTRPVGSDFAAGQKIDLKGQHLYPGLIALNTSLGLTEIEAVRATRDDREVGDYTPEVESWIAINPDSELIPAARANGITCFEPVPGGNIIAGQSALLAMDGWTSEQMVIRKPTALHLYWPRLELDTSPQRGRRGGPDSSPRSLAEQAKERRAKLQATEDFFEEARAYAKAKDAAAKNSAPVPQTIPAWEAMLPYVRGELPIVIHADEVRQIRSALQWAGTNKFKVALAGARDAWMVPELLATNHMTVIYENVFAQPVRDTESYDVHFKAPGMLHKAGVRVIVGTGLDPTFERNLPYTVAQAVAFGLPEDEALKSLSLYSAQLAGVGDRLGSIEVGKDATLFVCDGSILDLRANVKRMWIAGKEVSLETRHTRLYEKYKNRPKP